MGNNRWRKNYPSMPVVGQVVPFNAGDVEGVLAYWADDATVKLVGGLEGVKDSYIGKEHVRVWLQCLVAQHSQIKVKVVKVHGNLVTTRTETRNDLTGQMGIESLISLETYLVSDGKIVQLSLTISPESRLKLQSAKNA